MTPREPEILQRLFSSWVSLATEYAADTEDVRAFYLYASSEWEGTSGHRFANAYFDQAGQVVTPINLASARVSLSLARQVQQLMLEDLDSAEQELKRAGIPAPTEYRVFYEPGTGRLDVQLARENKYRGNDDLNPWYGIRYWLGDRAPRTL